MTAPLVLLPLLLLGLCLALIVPVLMRLFFGCKLEDVSPELFEDFSVSSHHAIEGLLNEEDFKFLSRQPGFDLSLYRKLRRERLSIFKQYLDRSIRDFNRLYAVVMALIPRATQDCSDVAGRLIWLKVRFSISVAKAECNYLLCVLGCRTLTVRSLVSQLEEISLQLSAVSALQAS